jgi:2-polyprenyl-6-methoxyphenol hydroxylase-like FAD-dependent oxidoreductase
MLLARAGYRVLLLDRASFPSDSMSTHLIHPPGVASLERWGLLDELAATGCPAIRSYSFDFGPFKLAGTPHGHDGVSMAYAPRRILLDNLLVEAAVRAGAELREGFTVEEVLIEDGRVTGIAGRSRDGTRSTELARVVVGADGVHSLIAEEVGASYYHDRPTLAACYLAYFSGVPTDGFEAFIRPQRGWAVIPTHDDLTVIGVEWPRHEFEANRTDVEGAYMQTLDLSPDFAARVRAGQRESRFIGTGYLPNYFRQSYGAGWALVGDAGYHKDPCTAMGISDAFRDAERLAAALDDALTGRQPFEHAMAAYQHGRDEKAMPMLEFTCQLASFEPPPPEMQRLLGAIHGNREATDRFISMFAGTLSVPEFFAPEAVEAVLAAASVPAAG